MAAPSACTRTESSRLARGLTVLMSTQIVSASRAGKDSVGARDGTELELEPGDAYVIEPGHDAEVVGGERFVGFEFQAQAAEEYARQ